MRKLTSAESAKYKKILKEKGIKKVAISKIDYSPLKQDLQKFEKSPTFLKYLRLIAKYDYNVFHPNKYYPNKYSTTPAEFRENLKRYRAMKKRSPDSKLTKSQKGKSAKVPSKCTVYFEKHNIPKDYSGLAAYIKSNTKTKLSVSQIKDILKEINKRGEGAFYSSGSRPGQTPQSWGKARVYCRAIDVLQGNKKPKSDGDLLKKI